MLECLTKINWKKVGLFASGTLFGTAGIKVLASDDAKKVYTNCTAAVLRIQLQLFRRTLKIFMKAQNRLMKNVQKQKWQRSLQKKLKQQKKRQQKKLKLRQKQQNSFDNLIYIKTYCGKADCRC